MNTLTVRLLDERVYEIELGDNSKVSGHITLISGNVGNGKNILSLEFLMFAAMENPIIACANFPVDIDLFEKRASNKKYPIGEREKENLRASKLYFLRNLEDFLSVGKNETHQIIVVDEGNAFGFEGRRSQSNDNLDFGEKSQHIRHYNADLILITQLYSMLDPRGRRMPAFEYHAIEPTNTSFRYAKMTSDLIMPFAVPKWYAQEFLYSKYDTTFVVGQDKPIKEPEKEKIAGLVVI